MQQNSTNTAALHYPKLQVIDSIVNDAISRKAFPGCVVFAAKDGEIVYHKSFGHEEYESSPAVSFESIYDLAISYKNVGYYCFRHENYMTKENLN